MHPWRLSTARSYSPYATATAMACANHPLDHAFQPERCAHVPASCAHQLHDFKFLATGIDRHVDCVGYQTPQRLSPRAPASTQKKACVDRLVIAAICSTAAPARHHSLDARRELRKSLLDRGCSRSRSSGLNPNRSGGDLRVLYRRPAASPDHRRTCRGPPHRLRASTHRRPRSTSGPPSRPASAAVIRACESRPEGMRSPERRPTTGACCYEQSRQR